MTPTATSIIRGAWIGGNDTLGEAEFAAHASQFTDVSPFWYRLNSDGVSLTALSRADNATIRNAAKAARVRVVPMIDGGTGDNIRAMINSPTKRAALVQAIVQLVYDHGYDGICADLEHLWTRADRVPFTAFMTELAASMHAMGKILVMAIPNLPTDDGNSAYSYAALSVIVDQAWIMGYELHGSWAHMGPLEPLGWVAGAMDAARKTGRPERFVLALMDEWTSENGYYGSIREALAACTGPLILTSDEGLTCPFGPWDPGIAPHCQTPIGMAWGETMASWDEKAQAAKSRGIAGISVWTLRPSDSLYAIMDRHYPMPKPARIIHRKHRLRRHAQ